MTVGLATAVLNGWLNAFGNATDYSAPAEIWVKLHVGDPGSAGTSNPAGETTRKQASFGSASGGVITTNADMDWTSVSTSETYTHISFWTASSGGTFQGSDDLAIPRVVIAGDDFSISSGSLSIGITPHAA